MPTCSRQPIKITRRLDSQGMQAVEQAGTLITQSAMQAGKHASTSGALHRNMGLAHSVGCQAPCLGAAQCRSLKHCVLIPGAQHSRRQAHHLNAHVRPMGRQHLLQHLHSEQHESSETAWHPSSAERPEQQLSDDKRHAPVDSAPREPRQLYMQRAPTIRAARRLCSPHGLTL